MIGIYENYKDKISLSAFNTIWYNQSWKEVEECQI